jgi:hypothetical protein
MSPWERLLEKPQSRGHFVQLYQRGDERPLVKNVSLYLSQGLKRGENAVVIANGGHREAFIRELAELGVDIAAAIRENWLVFFDAQETLSRFMVAGQPDWEKFRIAVGSALAKDGFRKDRPGHRAYGEMVGLLWDTGQFAAAIRLEQFWNRLLARSSFSLYCAYCIDVFGTKFHSAALDDVLCTHTHLLPSHSVSGLEAAFQLAMDEVLGLQADSLRMALSKADNGSSRAIMPKAENIILGLRKTIPGQAEQIIGRAREYYIDSCSVAN